jgi:hypothetical protein
MYNTENWKVWIPAGIGAYFAAGLVYYFCHFISNSFGASGVVALAAAFGYFLLLSSRANGSAAQVLNPLPMLIEVPPVRVLAEVKEALATKHFGDKKWSLDNMNEQKGAAQFTCRVKKEQDKNNDPKEHIAILSLKSERLSKASTLQLRYEIIGDEMRKHDALKLCKETTEYLESQIQNLINNPKSWV